MTPHLASAVGALTRRARRRSTCGRRLLVCHLAFAAGCCALVMLSLSLGTVRLSPPELVSALAGEASPALNLILEWRLPRVAAALCAGAALGLAGALFQTLMRNPLGSPDVIGFDAGAFSGAILALLAGAAAPLMAAASLAGGLAAGLLVYAAAGGGSIERSRLILTGIGIGAGFTALNEWLIFVAPLDLALVATAWRQGSLGHVDPARLALGVPILCLLLPLGIGCRHSMRILELGDDKALSLGEPPGAARLRLGLIGLGLTATATYISGPIGFVALIAPQVARRLAGTATLPTTLSALFGAFFLLGSDCAARALFVPRTLPVGVVTACLGGVYFVLLLRSTIARQGKSG